MIFVILLCSLFFSSEAAVCTGSVDIRNSTYGTISPTTGEAYPPNTDCSWTIYTATATQTPSIYFDPALFNVSTGDYVAISFNQIQQVEIGNGVAPPFRFMYGPLGGTIKLEFTSDADANTQTGFTAVYRIHYCNGNTQINDNTGSFTDGSGDTTNYQDWSECGWVIRGVPGERTVLRFDKFATEYNYDFVTIYDGADKTAPVLGQFSGNTVPPQVIGSIGTPMYVYFESDMTNNDAGFIASFARTANQTIGPQRSNNCTTYTANDLPILIPPGNATTGDTISTIEVSDSFTVGEVSVLNIQGNHTWMGDLNMYLTGPDGVSISQLVNRRCNGYPGFAFSFSDYAMTSSWPCPPTGGEWQPFTPLAVFSNKNSMGSWRLRVQDMEAGDNGELKGWQLRLCTPVASPAPVTSGANAPMTSGMTETHSEGTTGGSASQSDMTTGMTETHSEGTTGRSQQTPSTTGSRPAAATTGFDIPVQVTGDHHVDSVASGLPTKVYVAFVCILVVFFMRYM